MIDEKKLEQEIIILKKSMIKLVREKNKDYIGKIGKFNQMVILAVADFKCQRCGSEENLQIHHLIPRPAKDYMDFWRYVSQRNYWANQIVLCSKCHDKYHGFVGKDIEDRGIISKKKIKEVKEFFEADKNEKHKLQMDIPRSE